MTDTQQRITYSEPGFMGFGRWQAMLPEEPEWYYCTNRQGEGLFIQRLDSGLVRQITGLGQFMPRDFAHFKRMMRSIRNQKRANAINTPWVSRSQALANSERLEKLVSVGKEG